MRGGLRRSCWSLLVPFALAAPADGGRDFVATRAEMTRLYDTVFNPTMRCAIEEKRMAFAEGVVTLADGQVIATRTERGFRITRMSVLAGARSPAHVPQRLSLSVRPADFQLSGRLDYDNLDAYLLRLKVGDTLTANIERFPGRALVLRVRDVTAGVELAGAGGEFARTWRARASRTGEYRVEVARAGGYCDPDVTYVLTIGVR